MVASGTWRVGETDRHLAGRRRRRRPAVIERHWRAMGVFRHVWTKMATGRSATHPVGLDPIAGVDLTQYALIVKAIAPHDYDQSLLPGVAAAHGITAGDWQAAHDGWNERIQRDQEVARAFSDVYRSI